MNKTMVQRRIVKGQRILLSIILTSTGFYLRMETVTVTVTVTVMMVMVVMGHWVTSKPKPNPKLTTRVGNMYIVYR